MTIYIRTGDAGATTFFIGQRVGKTHPRVGTYDTLNELNVALSLRVCAVKTPQHRQLLENIQLQLFWLSAELTSESEESTPEQCYISSEETAALEAVTDTVMGRVPPLHSFILPGRKEAVSRLHFIRTLARRAERRLIELSTEIFVRRVPMRYTDRLSDCLYVLVRAEDHDAHQNDIIQRVARHYLVTVRAPAIKEPTISLSLRELHQLTHTAVTRAEKLQTPVVISIADVSGTQTATWHMPDALLVSSGLASKKAWIAVAMKTTARELASAVQPGATLHGLESHMQGKVVTLGGGYALQREGLLFGGLGVSEGNVEQGMSIVETVIAAVNVRTHQ